jgi:hypothetical protein
MLLQFQFLTSTTARGTDDFAVALPCAAGRAAVSRPEEPAGGQRRPAPTTSRGHMGSTSPAREAPVTHAAPGNRQASSGCSGLGDKTENKMVGKVMRDSWRESLSFPFKDTAALSRPLSPPPSDP